MNQGTYGGGPRSTATYAAAQSALQPISETLQVDESMQSLVEVVEFHMETLRALMRRLEPVTGEVSTGGDTVAGCGVAKVSLALRIDTQRDHITNATAMLQATIRALQI